MGNQLQAPAALDLSGLSAQLVAALDDEGARDRIRSVSRDAHLHKTQLPVGSGPDGLWTVDVATAGPLISVAQSIDPNLKSAFARVVPSEVSESVFWTAYLIRVAGVLRVPGASSSQPLAQHTNEMARPETTHHGRSAPAPEVDESLLLTLPEVFVYKLPPRPSARGHVAASWGLDAPVVTGYLRLVATAPAASSTGSDAASASSAAAGAASTSASGMRVGSSSGSAEIDGGEVSISLWVRPTSSSESAPRSSVVSGAGGGAPTASPLTVSAAAAAAAASAPSAVAARVTSSVSLAPLLSGHRLVAVGRIPLREALPSAPVTAAGGNGGSGAGSSVFSDVEQSIHAAVARHLEPVVDSSRYFVLKCAPPASAGFLGIGFRDRQAAFDLRTAIIDHCLRVLRQARGFKEEGEGEEGDRTAPGLGEAPGGSRVDGTASLEGGGIPTTPPSALSIPAGTTLRVSLPRNRPGAAAASEVSSPQGIIPTSNASGSGPGVPRVLAPPRSRTAGAAATAAGCDVSTAAAAPTPVSSASVATSISGIGMDVTTVSSTALSAAVDQDTVTTTVEPPSLAADRAVATAEQDDEDTDWGDFAAAPPSALEEGS
jgi:hypothetical protein